MIFQILSKLLKKIKPKYVLIENVIVMQKNKVFRQRYKNYNYYDTYSQSLFVKLFYNSKNIKNLFIAFKMYINEYVEDKSVIQIFFTKRDLNSAIALYKSKNPKVLPVAQPVINNHEKMNNLTRIQKPYILFVGGGRLLPNSIGILWFIKKVLSKIDFSLEESME